MSDTSDTMSSSDGTPPSRPFPEPVVDLSLCRPDLMNDPEAELVSPAAQGALLFSSGKARLQDWDC